MDDLAPTKVAKVAVVLISSSKDLVPSRQRARETALMRIERMSGTVSN